MTASDISILIGILSLICTIGIPLWQMRRCQIIHFFVNSYDIGTRLTDEFPKLRLHYGKKILSENVIVLKGGFANISRKDIGNTDKKTDIILKLPKGCVVKAVKVSPYENGLIVDCPNINNTSQNLDKSKNEDELCFEIDGIFKSKEWFNYTAIIEAPKEMNCHIYKQLKLEHRIKDITIKHLYLGPYYKNWLPSSIILIVLSIIYIPIYIGFMVYNYLKPEDLFNLYISYRGIPFFMFSIMFTLMFLLFLQSVAILLAKWSRKGRVISILTDKHKNSDFSYLESLFIQ